MPMYGKKEQMGKARDKMGGRGNGGNGMGAPNPNGEPGFEEFMQMMGQGQEMPMNMPVDQIRQMMQQGQSAPMPQVAPRGGMPMPSMMDPRLQALRRMLQA